MNAETLPPSPADRPTPATSVRPALGRDAPKQILNDSGAGNRAFMLGYLLRAQVVARTCSYRLASMALSEASDAARRLIGPVVQQPPVELDVITCQTIDRVALDRTLTSGGSHRRAPLGVGE